MKYTDNSSQPQWMIDTDKRFDVIRGKKARVDMAFTQALEIEAWMRSQEMDTPRLAKWHNLVETLRCLAQEVSRNREKVEHLAWDLEFAQKRNKALQVELDEIKANFYQPRH